METRVWNKGSANDGSEKRKRPNDSLCAGSQYMCDTRRGVGKRSSHLPSKTREKDRTFSVWGENTTGKTASLSSKPRDRRDRLSERQTTTTTSSRLFVFAVH